MKKRLLTLFLLLCPILFGAIAMATTGTVYVKASQKPYIHVWDDNNANIAGAWPGTLMKEVNMYGVTLYKYEFTYTADTYKVIFNNGSGTQSAEINGKTGTIYYKWDGSANSNPSEYDPTISQVELRGDFNGWEENAMTLNAGVYSSSIDLSNSLDDTKFKVVVKNGSGDYGWLGWNANNWTKTDTEGLLSPEGDGTSWDNIVVANSNKTYKTYNVNVTFTDATTWSLTFTGDEAREHTPYTVYFVDGNNWGDDNVYAYTFGPEQSGAWHGTKMTRDGSETIEGTSYPKYTYTFEAYKPYPTNIIFNNNDAEQTGNLVLTNGHKYIHGVDMDPVYAVVGSSTALFGSNWDAATTTAYMSGPVDGKYTYTANNVALEAQDITLKVIKKAYTETETVDAWYPTANVTLNIPSSGTYDVTVTFDSEAANLWDQSTVIATATPHLNTYTATYVNTEDWPNVYAYAWSGDGGSATIHTDTWPGTQLTEKEATQVDGHDVYKFSIVLSVAPEKIIFNGGDGQPQTANLDFVDGKQYSFVATDTYTVAGSSTQLFGAEWNYSEGSGNDMTKGEGTSTVYTKSYANVALSAGDIEYKVFKAYNNSTTFPAENAILNIATMGMYNVTFTFDASTNEVSAVAERQGDIPLTYSYVLAGDNDLVGADWVVDGSVNVMTENAGTYSLTLEDKTLEANNYGYKVVKLGKYNDKVYETTWIPDGMDNNKTVAIGEKGIYTITFTYDPTPGAANDGIAYSATPTQIEVPAISATGYATYSSAYALDFTDVTAFNAYIATGLDAQKQVVMASAQQKVPAATGLVLAAEGGCEATLVPVAALAPAIGDNLLVAHVAAGDVAASAGSEYRYVLAKKDDEVGFYKLATTLNLPANRAYLQTTEALATNSTGKVSWIFDDDETTNINALTLGRSALDPTQPMYNISGQRVGNDYKGIVIQNGKKYVNK